MPAAEGVNGSPDPAPVTGWDHAYVYGCVPPCAWATKLTGSLGTAWFGEAMQVTERAGGGPLVMLKDTEKGCGGTPVPRALNVIVAVVKGLLGCRVIVKEFAIGSEPFKMIGEMPEIDVLFVRFDGCTPVRVKLMFPLNPLIGVGVACTVNE